MRIYGDYNHYKTLSTNSFWAHKTHLVTWTDPWQYRTIKFETTEFPRLFNLIKRVV